MGYRSLVKNEVKRAFNAIKDLAIDVTFTNKNITAFNFNTQENVAGADVLLLTKAVLIENKKNSEKKLPVTSLLMKTEDVGNLDQYDTVTINGEVWNVVPPYSNDGYITSVAIVRGS